MIVLAAERARREAEAALHGRAWALAAEKGISLAEACREEGLIKDAEGMTANAELHWHARPRGAGRDIQHAGALACHHSMPPD